MILPKYGMNEPPSPAKHAHFQPHWQLSPQGVTPTNPWDSHALGHLHGADQGLLSYSTALNIDYFPLTRNPSQDKMDTLLHRIAQPLCYMYLEGVGRCLLEVANQVPHTALQQVGNIPISMPKHLVMADNIYASSQTIHKDCFS